MILLTLLLLAVSPPEAAPEYVDARKSLDAALDTVGAEDMDAAECAVMIRDALDLLARFPGDIPNDAATLDKLTRARVALAWLLLVDGNEVEAIAAIDEALRSAQGTALPVGAFGPKVRALHDERLRALKEFGTAMLEVDCGNVACQVVIDERRSANPSAPLYLGTYRVWIGTRDGMDWEWHEVELETVGGTETLVYQAGVKDTPELDTELGTESVPIAPAPVVVPVAVPPLNKPRPKRMIPLWAEGLGIAAGVGMVVAAGILLAYDTKCESGANPTEGKIACPGVYQNKPQAYSLFGIGGAVTLAFGATLAVDQVRLGRVRGQQAVLNWTIRF